MKYKINRFNENVFWDDVIGSHDVGQLIELIKFKYGMDIIPESIKEFDEDDGDYNPDDNYQSYVIEKEENDPFHWRHRKKQQDEFVKRWKDLL